MESWGLVNCFDVAQYTFYDETGLASDEPPPKPPKLATCHSGVPSAKINSKILLEHSRAL